MADDIILDVKNLSVDYASATGTVHAVDHVSLTLRRREIFGLAGESGSGKSTLAFAIARLLKYPAQITGGQIIFHPLSTEGTLPIDGADNGGIDILALSPQELRAFRWSKLAIVFQSAMNALNPVISIATQITDVIQAHDPKLTAKQRLDRAAELFRLVGISPDRLRNYPHQLSGGMRQRAVLAIALALNPELIILDEPTTALDVVVQRDILNELRMLQTKFGFSVLFITHDLSLLLEISDHLGIMYAGRMVEVSGQGDLLTHPLHPYTYGLIHAFPELYGEKQTMMGIPGHPPDLRHLPAGCPFAPRCAFAFAACHTVTPPLRAPDRAQTDHTLACHLYDPAYNANDPPVSVDPSLAPQTPRGVSATAGGVQ